VSKKLIILCVAMMILKEENWLKDLQGDVFRCSTNLGGTPEKTSVAATIKLSHIFSCNLFCLYCT